jgi:hypothetical protein
VVMGILAAGVVGAGSWRWFHLRERRNRI